MVRNQRAYGESAKTHNSAQDATRFGTDAAGLRYYTEADVCQLLGVNRATLLRARKAGLLRYAQVLGRVMYTREHLDEFRAGCERQAVPAQRRPRRRPARCGQ
jgi:hypothetical protein